MYSVSPAYQEAIAAPQRVTCVSGSIALADDHTIITIGDADIVQGSLYVSSQCVNGDDIDIGSVYASELGFTLKTDMENPYSLEGARVTLQFGLEVAGGSFEWVPLGTFYADVPTRQAGKVALKCYDGQLLFDKPIDETPSAGTPYVLLADACYQAGVTLFTSRQEIEAMPNGTLTLTPPTGDSAIKTWRDLIMWVCQALAGFAAMNRMGQLEIRGYGSAFRRVIDPGIRLRTTAADTQMQVTQVTMKLGDTTYSQGGDGMTMALETNPLFWDLDAATVDAALASIKARVGAVQYVPATVEFNGDPALDPGDLVTLPATPAGDLTIPVMKSTWHYRGRHSIAAVGKSARLRSEYSQTSKAVSAIAAQASAATQLATLAADQTAELINNTRGGHVLIRQITDPLTEEKTNEILIMDNKEPTLARKIWRWNLGGLGYSADGDGVDDNHRVYETAITMDGEIKAKFVRAGEIGTDVVFAGELQAAHGDIDRLVAGNESGARIELGAINSDPYIDIYSGAGVRQRLIRKDSDTIGDPAHAHIKQGVDGAGDPYIDIYDDKNVRQRSMSKFGDLFGTNIIQRTYALGTRSGMGVFIA